MLHVHYLYSPIVTSKVIGSCKTHYSENLLFIGSAAALFLAIINCVFWDDFTPPTQQLQTKARRQREQRFVTVWLIACLLAGLPRRKSLS